jgi:hypothetical protein
MKTFVSFIAVALFASVGTAFAQSAEGPRTVGHKGAKQIGINFSTTTSLISGAGGSTASLTNMFGGIDVGRFVSDKLVTRFGISGSGQVGGQDAGSSVSFNMLGGALIYMTPQKPQSLYIGGDVSIPLSSNGAGDPYVNGRLGVQAAIRSNAAIFVEGGYGTQISRTEGGGGMTGSLQSNIGVRVLF